MGWKPADASGGSRVLFGLVLVVALGLTALWFVSEDERPDRDEVPQAADSARAPEESAPPVQPRADGIFEPDERGRIRIAASRLAAGEPVLVEIRLSTDEIGDEPMAVSLRTPGQSHDLGFVETVDPTGAARISIPASTLAAGESLLSIRTADASWNPSRRVVITVSE